MQYLRLLYLSRRLRCGAQDNCRPPNLRGLLRSVAAGAIEALYFIQILWRFISDIRHGVDTAAQKENGAMFGAVVGVWDIRPDLRGGMWRDESRRIDDLPIGKIFASVR
jgi:hypothetical protein